VESREEIFIFIDMWSFTDFCFWLDRIARNNRLLDIPFGKTWRFYVLTVYANIILGCLLVVMGVCCFSTGIQNSFLYDKVNCSGGSSLAAPMCNMVVVFLLIVSLKQQQSGWTCFTAFVFILVVTSFNVFFLYDTLEMAFHWLCTESRQIPGQNWPQHFAWIDGAMVLILLLIELTDLILITFYLLLASNFTGWKTPNSTTQEQITSHSRFH